MRTMKLLTVALVAVTMFASCSKENERDPSKRVIEGGPATMSLSLTFPRTYTNETASEKESKINLVSVFIFNAADGALVAHRSLTLTDFTKSGNMYTNTVGIVTTAGTRKIGVGINLPPAMVDKITGTLKNITAVNAATVYDVTSTLLATDNKFVMFSTEMPEVDLATDADIAAGSSTANKFKMDIERMAGKGALATTAGFAYPAGITNLGNFGTLEYKLMQTNLKSYLMAEGRSIADRRDPNYLSADFVPKPSTPTSPKYNEDAFEKPGDVYKTLGSITDDSGDHSKRPAFYGAENVSDFYQTGTITYFMVRGQFTPNKFSDGTGSTATPSYTSGDDFWVVTNGTTTHICADASTATNLAADTNTFPPSAPAATITKHVEGYCYWAVLVGNDNERHFLRNNYYLGQVKAIKGFGKGTEVAVVGTSTDPADGSKATIDIEFNMLNWTFNVGDEVELN